MRSAARSPLSFTTVALTALVASAGAVACTAPDGRAADPRTGKTSSPVIKGTTSPASQDSVVMILLGEGGGFCSGTLIAPNVVLTARHCVSNYAEDDCGTFTGDIPPSTEGIVVGGAANEQSAPVAHAKKYFYVDGAKGLCDPAVDIAVILLDRSLTGTPTSKVRGAPVTVGETFVAVGYGEDENKQVSVRRQRTGVQAVAVGPAKKTFTPTDGAAPYEYELPAGEIAVSEAVCHGDSGGPLFDSELRVVGVTSRGTDPLDVCVARPDIFSAVAQHMDVIDRALTEAGHPRSAADETTTKAKADPDTSSSDETDTSDEEEDPAPTPKKKSKNALGSQPNAGCAVARVSSRGTTGADGTAAGLALVALGVVLRRQWRKRRVA